MTLEEIIERAVKVEVTQQGEAWGFCVRACRRAVLEALELAAHRVDCRVDREARPTWAGKEIRALAATLEGKP